MLELQNICYRVSTPEGEMDILRDISITIPDQRLMVFTGPNGGGKTTLVKAILGTVPHTGEVRLAPELFRHKERQIGYMPQLSDFDRTFPISVLEVVLSGLQGHKGIFSRYTKADRAKALGLLETAGVADTARNPIGEVSGGQMQRALLCRAVISYPKLLILDEPTAGLDPKERVRLRTLLAEMATDRIILVATHVVSDVETVATEVILLRAGKIVDAAPVPDLIDKYAPGQGLEDVYLAVFGEGDGK